MIADHDLNLDPHGIKNKASYLEDIKEYRIGILTMHEKILALSSSQDKFTEPGITDYDLNLSLMA